jgi:hypothetical protein
MTLAQDEETKLVFSPEQRHVLGMLYGFLIELGRERLKRLEKQAPDGAGQVGSLTNNESSELIEVAKE